MNSKKTKYILLSIFAAGVLSGCSGGRDNEQGFDSNENLLNEDPVAIIDSIVEDENGVVTLDGHSSYDPDGYLIAYAWQTNTGEQFVTTDSITKMSGLPKGEYFVELTVYDNEKHQDKAKEVFTIIHEPNDEPVAKGEYNPELTQDDDGRVSVGEEFGLDGSKSYDKDGSIVQYDWTVRYLNASGQKDEIQKEGITAIFPDTVTTQEQVIEASLKVTDNDGGIGYTSFSIPVGTNTPPPIPNTPPTADASATNAYAYYTPTSSDAVVDVNGSKSSDSDGNIVEYKWTNQTTGVSYYGETLTIHKDKDSDTTFILQVTDDDGDTDSDDVLVRVALNNPPVADAGAETWPGINPSEDTVADLDGSGSTDDGNIEPMTYSWVETTQEPRGVTITLQDENTVSPSFVLACSDNPQTGEGYNCHNGEGTVTCDIDFELTVSDGQSTSTDTTVVHAEYSCNNPE